MNLFEEKKKCKEDKEEVKLNHFTNASKEIELKRKKDELLNLGKCVKEYIYMWECVDEWERESERESVRVCVSLCVKVNDHSLWQFNCDHVQEHTILNFESSWSICQKKHGQCKRDVTLS